VTCSSRCSRCSTTSRLAREHGDLVDGPFAAIADKLEAVLAKYGIERFGAKGDEFDPMHHEALMHAPWPEGDRPADRRADDGRHRAAAGLPAGERSCAPPGSRSPTPPIH
jgi:molecular chaperone GrpE